jgi:hypothetical protein
METNPRKMIRNYLKHCFIIALVLGGLFAVAPGARANGMHGHHDLEIDLFPASGRLAGVDNIHIKSASARILEFRITDRATQISAAVNHKPRPFNFENGRLKLALEPHEQAAEIRVTIKYEGVFNDPVPVRPVNADNPGYGVSATISPEGSFLLAGAGWYPELANSQATYRLKVRAPAGMIAVTAGRSLGHKTDQGQTESVWEVDYPVQGLSLSVGRYIVEEKPVGKVTAATYLLPDNQHLAQSYLDASAGYLALYSDLFGPYPFHKFAVVENFFPTGFGFPSYTLMGGRVLRLPFIIHTSLGHEIAHCWWGNGVYVDYAAGNWSEALTSYVADYLYQEMKSKKAALDYRRQWLRNFSTLVNPENDFPLDRFVSRHNPASKAVGYDKGAMVFHMIRQRLGEAAFWNALRDIYRQRLFQKTSWADLQKAFEHRGQRSLQSFFDQWLHRRSAPQLFLEDIRLEHTAGIWKVSGQIVQQDPAYDVAVNLVLETTAEEARQQIELGGKTTAFEMTGSQRPRRLLADPGFDIMRRLHAAEIPPAVNNIKGSSSVKIVLSDQPKPGLKQVAETLALSLGLKNYQFVSAGNVQPSDLAGNDILLIGHPGQGALMPEMPDQISINSGSFTLNNARYSGSADSFFGVFHHPLDNGRIAGLFMPPSEKTADIVARKITHYGKYSYLAFQAGKNMAKGIWPAEKSPLVHEFR